MSDKDTQAKARFEPPPWEREAFDALAARRAEEQAALEALAAASAASAAAAAAEANQQEKPQDPWAEEPIAKTGGLLETDGGEETQAARKPAGSADEKVVEAMLLQLQAEEKTDPTVTRWVGWIASALTFALGGAMLIYGLLAARDSGGKFANVVGSGVLSIFGLCFMGMALWVWISTNRSKGR
jgi:ATP-dependent exoDNAse (exonuclease V) beta subunit